MSFWIHGVRIVPDDDCPEGMVATRDEDGNLVPLGFLTDRADPDADESDSETV